MTAQIVAWRDEGLEPRVSFNVSPRELLRPDFAPELGERIRAAGVDPALLTMELTESATLREPERIGPLLRDLRAGGAPARDRRLRRRVVVALAPAAAAGADPQDRPVVPARDP